MDSFGVILFIVLMVFSFLSKKKKADAPPDYDDYEDYNDDYYDQPKEPKPRKWDIPGPTKDEVKIETAPPVEEKVEPVFTYQEPEPVKVWAYTPKVKEHIPSVTQVKQENAKPKAEVNWQQAMVLSQILSEPKGKQLLKRYSRIR